MVSIKAGARTDLTLQELTVKLDELLGLYDPQISMIPYGCFSHPLACSLCVYSNRRIGSQSHKASTSGAGSIYTHIDIPDGNSTCHVVRLDWRSRRSACVGLRLGESSRSRQKLNFPGVGSGKWQASCARLEPD